MSTITSLGGPSATGTFGVTSAEDRTFPFSVGLAVFLCTVGSSLPLGDYGFYLRAGLMPLIVLAAWITRRTVRSVRDIRFSPSLTFVVFWFILAAGWTPLPFPDGFRFALLFPAMAITAHLGAAVFDPDGLLRAMTVCAVLVLAAVGIHSIVDPAAAFSLLEGDPTLGGTIGMRSFFYHKNSLGIFLAFSVALLPVIRSPKRRAWVAVGIVALLVPCNSSTAWVMSICIVTGWFLVNRAARARRNGSRGGVFLMVSFILIAIGSAVAGRSILFGLLGRESNITGRDVIWRYGLEAALDRPWFGWGPGGVWEREVGPAYTISRVARFDVPSSHQGVIDLVMDYGIIGLVLFAVAFVATVTLVVRRVLAGDAGRITVVSFGLTTVIFLGSLTESNLAAPGLQVMALVSGMLWNAPPARDEPPFTWSRS